MFAAVFYTADKSVDVVNKKKLHPACADKISVGAPAKVQYLTEDIDESGRDVRSIKDFDGIIVRLGNARGEVEAFAAEQQERLRDAYDTHGDNGVIKFALDHNVESGDPKPRRRKKTTKLQEFENEMRDRPSTSQSKSDSARGRDTPTAQDKSFATKAIPTSEAKTKKTKEKVQPKKPSTATVEKQKTAECQKLQTIEYFKKKKAVTNAKSGGDMITTPQIASNVIPATCISSPPAMPRTSSPVAMPRTSSPPALPRTSSPVVMPRTSLPPVMPRTSSPVVMPRTSLPPVMPRTSSPPAMPRTSSPPVMPRTSSPLVMPRTSLPPVMPRTLSPPAMPKSPAKENLVQTPVKFPTCTVGMNSSPPKTPDMYINLTGPVLRSSTKKRRLIDINEEDNSMYFENRCRQQRQPFVFGSSTTTSSAVGQGFDVLNGCFNFGCRQKVDAMEQDAIGYRYRITSLEAENDELRKQLHNHKSTASDHSLLQQLKMFVEKWEMKNFSQSQQHLQDQSPFGDMFSQTPPSCSYFESPLMSEKLSTIKMKVVGNDVSKHNSSTVSTAVDEGEEEDFSQFFQPGDGKVLLLDGHGVYVNETKMALMKKKTMKSESRMTRCLLDYFFSPKYLAAHSATGEKSNKPALHGKIILAVKGYLLQCFKTSDSALNAIINRKCLDSKRNF